MSSANSSQSASSNPLQDLNKHGQSVWLDCRNVITGGELLRMVQEDRLEDVASNPAIVEKAITSSTGYAEALVDLQKEKGLDAMTVYERIAIRNIQDAADVLRPAAIRIFRGNLTCTKT